MATTLRTYVTVKAPAEQVWKILMDPGKLPGWLTGFISIQHLSGEPGKAGSKSKMVFLQRGKKMEVQEEVVKVNPHREYIFKIVHPSMFTYNSIGLSVNGGETSLEQVSELHPQNFLVKLVMPFMKNNLRKVMQHDLNKLKNIIENNL